MTAIPGRLDLSALAHVLFASPVQPSQHPSREAIKAAIEMQLSASHGDPAVCVLLVVQEAGDHPDLYLARMQWARQSVARAYCDHRTVNTRPRCSAGTPSCAPGFLRGAA
jgi:hypothetical protein